MTAVIEVGTHSVKCLRDGRDAVTITRLGEGLARTGRIAPAAAARTLRAIRRYLPGKIVATHALRVATNRAEVLRRWGLDVRVLSEQQEARYSFLGATSGLSGGPFFTVDVGGGSTEIVGGGFATLLPIGAATLTQRFRDPRPILARIPWRRFRGARMVAVGGTAATVAALATERPISELHGTRVPRRVLAQWLERFRGASIAERCRFPGVDRGRADVLPAGMLVLLEAATLAGRRVLTISTRGVRHAVALGRRT